jgi:hypothetical protein
VGRRGRGSWVEGFWGVCVYEVMVVGEGGLCFSSHSAKERSFVLLLDF